jgi:hypothetical protein
MTLPPQSPPHGEERGEAARLEHRKSGLPDLRIQKVRSRVNPRSVAAGASGAIRAALVLRDALDVASAPQDEGGEGA